MPHIHEKIDFTISVFIVNKNRVLIRKHDKYSIWIGVGGHIELDEDPNQAALREAKEEVGLEIELVGYKPSYEHPGKAVHLIPPRFLNRHFISENHEHVDLIYLATSKTNTVVPENQNDEWAWLSENELDDPKYNLSETIKLYAKTALEEAGSKN